MDWDAECAAILQQELAAFTPYQLDAATLALNAGQQALDGPEEDWRPQDNVVALSDEVMDRLRHAVMTADPLSAERRAMLCGALSMANAFSRAERDPGDDMAHEPDLEPDW